MTLKHNIMKPFDLEAAKIGRVHQIADCGWAGNEGCEKGSDNCSPSLYINDNCEKSI